MIVVRLRRWPGCRSGKMSGVGAGSFMARRLSWLIFQVFTSDVDSPHLILPGPGTCRHLVMAVGRRLSGLVCRRA